MLRVIIFLIIVVHSHSSVLATSKIHNLVEPVKYFSNHQVQLSDLVKKLYFTKKVTLLGMSGMGKTQLARMYAYQNFDKYNIIWVFDCNLDLNTQFTKLAEEINKQDSGTQLSTDLLKSQNDVINYLTPKNNWLLIFDNLGVNQNNRVKDIIKWENNGHIIFVSQDADGLPEAITTPYFQERDIIQLTETLINNSPPELMREVVNEFKGHPLLTVQGILFLNNNKYLNMKEYKQIIGSADDKIGAHVTLVLKTLSSIEKDLLFKITLLNTHKFSKEILFKITSHRENLPNDIYSLIRFGLITSFYDENGNLFFEMHDMVKNAILKIADNKITQDNIIHIVNVIKAEISNKSYEEKFLLMATDFSSNLEVLLRNANLYEINLLKIMELRQILLDFYLNSRQVYHAQKEVEWFRKHEDFFSSSIKGMTKEEKVVYSNYLSNIGTYTNFFEGTNPRIAIKYLQKAIEIITPIAGYVGEKLNIYCQLAQVNAYTGDNQNAIATLNIVEKLMAENPEINFEKGLISFTKAKILLSESDYVGALEKALEALNLYRPPFNEGLSKEAEKNIESSLAPIYTMQAEILNYMGRYKEAYDIANKVYFCEIEAAGEENETTAYALVQISRAALGISNYELALESSSKAKNFYLNDPARKNVKIIESNDSDFAAALVAEADALYSLGRVSEAIESYSMAEAIFYNKYRENMKFVDEISYLYYRASLASYGLAEQAWYEKFSKSHIELFGLEHPRTIKILEIRK
jgi:tetratricopeptide (TPR) repeat protein